MDNESYVAEKVTEAFKDAKALLLGAIGAMSPTPSSSAKAAKKLDLSREEIQRARWVAIFKKGKTSDEFLRGILEIFQNLQQEEKMEKEINDQWVFVTRRGFPIGSNGCCAFVGSYQLDGVDIKNPTTDGPYDVKIGSRFFEDCTINFCEDSINARDKDGFFFYIDEGALIRKNLKKSQEIKEAERVQREKLLIEMKEKIESRLLEIRGPNWESVYIPLIMWEEMKAPGTHCYP